MSYKRKDALHQKAKSEGYRSRAAYKLIELNKKYSLLKVGQTVLDLGCWPGGWMQVASKIVGQKGLVVGIDLAEQEPLNLSNAHFLLGDACDEDILKKAFSLLPDPAARFDLVISDMSPKLTGIREVDQAGTSRVIELALYVADNALRADGSVIIKCFPGNDTELVIKSARKKFQKIIRTVPDATRKSSNEFYIIGVGYKGVDS
jgi:23S rRNA (uridine2552-2'-O)-methyltransferase